MIPSVLCPNPVRFVAKTETILSELCIFHIRILPVSCRQKTDIMLSIFCPKCNGQDPDMKRTQIGPNFVPFETKRTGFCLRPPFCCVHHRNKRRESCPFSFRIRSSCQGEVPTAFDDSSHVASRIYWLWTLTRSSPSPPICCLIFSACHLTSSTSATRYWFLATKT